jgi:hypothetical protein
MEPRKSEKPAESRGKDQTSPPHQSEKPRRFRITKLEERIAPGGHNTQASRCYSHCIACTGWC